MTTLDDITLRFYFVEYNTGTEDNEAYREMLPLDVAVATANALIRRGIPARVIGGTLNAAVALDMTEDDPGYVRLSGFDIRSIVPSSVAAVALAESIADSIKEDADLSAAEQAEPAEAV